MKNRVGAAGLALLAGIVIGVLLQVSGATSGSAAFYWGGVGGDHQTPVEQESPNYFYNNCGGNPANPVCDPSSWVTNPTPCAWDLDDFTRQTGSGDITGDTTATLCTIADGYDSYGGDNKGVYAYVFASKLVDVTVMNTAGLAWTVPHGPRGRFAWGTGYLWNFCALDLTGYPNPAGSYPTVEGSNGGSGSRVGYTLRVHSPAGTTRGVSAGIEIAGTTGPHIPVTC